MGSLYDRLGGSAAIRAAVDLFYEKVLGDASLAPFFEGTDMTQQKSHQRAMLTAAFGGPNAYEGRDLTTAHAKLVSDGLNDAHFDAVVGHLAATLKELGVADAEIAEAGAVAESVRGAVLGRG